jgi:hypothetical protein
MSKPMMQSIGNYPAGFATQAPRLQHGINQETQAAPVPLPPAIHSQVVGQLPTLVYKVPLVSFGADILVGAGVRAAIDVFGQMGANCVGFSILNVTAPVVIYINNGGGRTVFQDVVYDDAEINNLIVTGGAAGCTVQLHGV